MTKLQLRILVPALTIVPRVVGVVLVIGEALGLELPSTHLLFIPKRGTESLSELVLVSFFGVPCVICVNLSA